MSDLLNVEHGFSERKRAQLRQAAGIMGIDEAYLSRMVNLFVARVCADKRLGRICVDLTGVDRAQHLDRLTEFWASITLYTTDYPGDLVEAHRNLHHIRREDFARWLELFRATLDETAPTPEAANYLMVRAERVAHGLATAMFDPAADDGPDPHNKPTPDME